LYAALYGLATLTLLGTAALGCLLVVLGVTRPPPLGAWAAEWPHGLIASVALVVGLVLWVGLIVALMIWAVRCVITGVHVLAGREH
jgi:hypothetical protein